MRIFALDPGSHSGWALSDPGYVMSGSTDHEEAAREQWWDDRAIRGAKAGWAKFPKEERLKRILGIYVLWLEGALEYWRPDVLVVERQAPHRGNSNSNVLEFRGATLGVAGRKDLALVECWPAQWRRHLGSRPYDPATDHQLAAEMILAWWQAEQSRDAA